MKISARLELVASGWVPIGRGEIRAEISGHSCRPLPLVYDDRGALGRVWGRAIAANLPAHVAQRMADRTGVLLRGAGISARISARRVPGACAGAALFVGTEYAQGRADVTAVEVVAKEAVAELLACHRSGAAVDCHLANQLIVPAAVAEGASSWPEGTGLVTVTPVDAS